MMEDKCHVFDIHEGINLNSIKWYLIMQAFLYQQIYAKIEYEKKTTNLFEI